jgi:hypothetical protein
MHLLVCCVSRLSTCTPLVSCASARSSLLVANSCLLPLPADPASDMPEVTSGDEHFPDGPLPHASQLPSDKFKAMSFEEVGALPRPALHCLCCCRAAETVCCWRLCSTPQPHDLQQRMQV